MPGRIDFPEFLSAVRSLWSRTRMSDDEIRHTGWTHIDGRQADDVIAALKKHRADEPDAASPTWKAVWRILREQRGENGGQSNDFQILLTQCRRYNSHVKGIQNWSDAEVFQAYVDANTYPITHNTITHTPCADDDGRLARHAADWRHNEADHWRTYLLDAGLLVPAFLTE